MVDLGAHTLTALAGYGLGTLTDGNVAVNPGAWPLPAAVALDGDTLRWRYQSPGRPLGRPSMVTAATGLLPDFMALHRAEPGAIVDFALRWGVLDLCRHGLPIGHTIRRRVPGDAIKPARECPAVTTNIDGYDWNVETLLAWRRTSREAEAIVRLAVDLRSDRTGSEGEWSALPEFRVTLHAGERIPNARLVVFRPATRTDWRVLPTPAPTTVYDGRQMLAVQVSRWLRWGRIEPVLAWDERPMIDLRPTSLFGAIALELAALVSGGERIVACTHCGKPYEPTRRPAPSRRNFCTSCRNDGIPMKYADEDRRRRTRDATDRAKKERDDHG